MSAANLLGRVRGACSLHRQGQDFWTKDIAAQEIDLKAFKVPSNAYGSLSRRQGGRVIQVKFTPVGVWTAAQLAVLFPAFLLNPRLGDFNTPIRTVTFTASSANAVSTGHQLITGTGVRFGTVAGVTLPTGISPNVTYWLWCNADGNTVQFYDTEAHAMASTGANGQPGQVVVSTAGSGTIQFIQNTPLIITTTDGFQLTLWNAAIVDMPDLSLGTLDSVMKTFTIEAYTLHGMNWSDANSQYTPATGVIAAVPPPQAQIPTVPYTIDWETRLPVTAVNTGSGTVTVANHGLVTGQAVTMDNLSTGGTLPGGITAGEALYAIAVDANTLSFATSYGNAESDTIITLTSTGSGTIDVVPIVNLAGMQPREAVDVSTKVTWNDVMTNGNGLLCRSIKEVETTVSFVPDAVAYASLLTLLATQGGSAALGQALPIANLDIYGPGENPFLRVYGASLTNAPARYGAEADRVDKLTFVSNRTFRGTAQNPVVAIGVAAPTV